MKKESKNPYIAADLTINNNYIFLNEIKNTLLDLAYKGVDPETSLTGSGNSQGMDYFNMPNTKSWGFSLRVTL